MNRRTLGKIGAALLVLGLGIQIPTQLADYNYTQNQWIPSWSFFVYMSGIALVFIGLGIGVFAVISWKLDKGQ